MITDCLSDEAFAAWNANELPADERERAIEHVAGCTRCRALLAHLFAAPASVPQRIGRYAIAGPLGAGGMGVVLRGRDETLGRDVAIKMVKAWLVEAGHRDRMLREAQAMAQVRHPNVVTVHELGEAGGEVFVAMELVTGTMLHRWLAAAPRARAARIGVALGIGRGIAAVHAADLLHRDIKPDNIIVRDDGTPVLVDFGLARQTRTPVLGAGSGFAGTPDYVAPEVAAGQPATAASDQYQWWTIVDQALGEDPRIARVIARGRDPDPVQRFAGMPEAIAALEAALAPPSRAIACAALAILVCIAATAVAWQAVATPACVGESPAGWSSAARAQVTAQLWMAGIPPDRVLAALDARAAATTELRREACEADPGDRATWARRTACVDETWAHTRAAIRRLSAARTVHVGTDDLAAVLPVERCARGSLPAIPERLHDVAELRYLGLDAAVRALESATDRTAAARLAGLRALGPQVAALHHPPLDGRWHWAVAHALADTQAIDAAAAEIHLAAQAGLAAGDDDLYVRALIFQLHVTSTAASPAQVASLEADALAGARRLGNPEIDAQLLIARANLAMEHGDSAKARPLFEQALAELDTIALATMPQQMQVTQDLGAICLEAGDFVAGDRYLDRAVDFAGQRYGEHSGAYWEARAARATSYLFRKDLIHAEPELRAAADGLDRDDPRSNGLGMIRAYLCIMLLGENRIAEARAQCAASVAATTTLQGPASSDLVWPLTLSGQVELRAERPTDGLVFLRRAVALAEANHVRPMIATIARCYLAIGLAFAHQTAEAHALAVQIAPALRDSALAEAHGDFARSFPELR